MRGLNNLAVADHREGREDAHDDDHDHHLDKGEATTAAVCHEPTLMQLAYHAAISLGQAVSMRRKP